MMENNQDIISYNVIRNNVCRPCQSLAESVVSQR